MGTAWARHGHGMLCVNRPFRCVKESVTGLSEPGKTRLGLKFDVALLIYKHFVVFDCHFLIHSLLYDAQRDV